MSYQDRVSDELRREQQTQAELDMLRRGQEAAANVKAGSILRNIGVESMLERVKREVWGGLGSVEASTFSQQRTLCLRFNFGVAVPDKTKKVKVKVQRTIIGFTGHGEGEITSTEEVESDRVISWKIQRTGYYTHTDLGVRAAVETKRKGPQVVLRVYDTSVPTLAELGPNRTNYTEVEKKLIGAGIEFDKGIYDSNRGQYSLWLTDSVPDDLARDFIDAGIFGSCYNRTQLNKLPRHIRDEALKTIRQVGARD